MMGAWRPKHVEKVCSNKICILLHHVGVLFNLILWCTETQNLKKIVRHIEVLHVIKILHVKGSDPAKIQNQLEVFRKQVWILCNAFINCRTGADDRQRPGRPSTSITDDKGCGSVVPTGEHKCVNVKQADSARHLEILSANTHSIAHHQVTAQ